VPEDAVLVARNGRGAPTRYWEHSGLKMVMPLQLMVVTPVPATQHPIAPGSAL
jgi:hypothetical protein